MLEWFGELLQKFGDMILSVLPKSPFDQYIQDFANLPYLGWLNWFIPVAEICSVTLAWLGAISVFYLYSIIMRWIKMIGD